MIGLIWSFKSALWLIAIYSQLVLSRFGLSAYLSVFIQSKKLFVLWLIETTPKWHTRKQNFIVQRRELRFCGLSLCSLTGCTTRRNSAASFTNKRWTTYTKPFLLRYPRLSSANHFFRYYLDRRHGPSYHQNFIPVTLAWPYSFCFVLVLSSPDRAYVNAASFR